VTENGILMATLFAYPGLTQLVRGWLLRVKWI